MKAIKIISMIALLITSVAHAQYIEGKHYTKLNLPETNQPEVVEYFSYFCPACRNMEFYLAEIKASLPDKIHFKKTHANIMRNASTDVQHWLAVGYEYALYKGIEPQYSQAVFSYIQDRRKPFKGMGSLVEIFTELGMRKEDIKKGIRGFAIQSRAKRHETMTKILRDSDGLRGVPTFVINGKYVVENSELDTNNFARDLANLAKFLSK